MRKQTRAWMAMTMAVAMTAATISSAVPGNGITAEAASIRLSKTKLSLKVGQSKQLTVKGTKKAVKWSVSNGKIVKVTKKGKVTAKKAGTAKVFAKVKGKKLTCNVKVAEAPNQKTTMAPSSSPKSTGSTANTGSTGSNGTKSSSAPNGTGTPTVSTGPAITPTATNTAKATEAPVETQDPEYTKGPQPTETPKVEKITIKIGETKKVTVDGIKFTYTIGEKYGYAKLENTTEDAKLVDMSVKNLDSNGKFLAEFGFEEAYLGAGQTYYADVHDASLLEEEGEAESFEVGDVKVRDAGSKYEDCLDDIEVEQAKGEITEEGQSVTIEYTGDVSALDGKDVCLPGSIVYYDSDDNIVLIGSLHSDWKLSSENKMETTVELLFGMLNITRYEVVLGGAYIEHLSASDEPTPEPTKSVKPTNKPEPTASVKPTNKPVPTESAKPTNKPEPTASIQPTKSPIVASKEIEVGDTETDTVDGVKFTYIAQEDQIFIKMENTNKSAKQVKVSIDEFDLDGNKVDTTVNSESIPCLSAGKTYVGYVKNYSKTGLSKYAVNTVKVEEMYSFYRDCLSEINVEAEDGTDAKKVNIILEYTGDASKIGENGIWVRGSVVYYDSEDNIVATNMIINKIDPSTSKTETVKKYYYGEAEVDHYEVILSGAYCNSNSN